MIPVLGVFTEIDRLHLALVHEPGPEIDRMVPAMMEQLLFDDILYGERARDEHARFRRILQLLGVEVLEAAELLNETLRDKAARRFLLDVALEELPESLKSRVEQLPGERLAEVLITGARLEVSSGTEVDELYGVTPLPNWCFQRDPQIVLGRGLIFGAMATAARHREGLLARAIFHYHPRFVGTRVILDPLEATGEQRLFAGQEQPHLEGGDVMVFSPSVIVMGLSERTNRAAVRCLSRALARREEGPRFMVVVEIPHRRAYMHLDTLITQIDRDAALVHVPVLQSDGPGSVRVFEIDLHSEDLTFEPRGSLLGALAAHGVDLEPIPCGGSDPVAQQREQWTDGANALAVAPGVITLFDRNTATTEELARHGFRIIVAEDLLLGREELDLDATQRVCILIQSQEISRARGGPHCLVHPLRRAIP